MISKIFHPEIPWTEGKSVMTLAINVFDNDSSELPLKISHVSLVNLKTQVHTIKPNANGMAECP